MFCKTKDSFHFRINIVWCALELCEQCTMLQKPLVQQRFSFRSHSQWLFHNWIFLVVHLGCAIVFWSRSYLSMNNNIRFQQHPKLKSTPNYCQCLKTNGNFLIKLSFAIQVEKKYQPLVLVDRSNYVWLHQHHIHFLVSNRNNYPRYRWRWALAIDYLKIVFDYYWIL